MKLRAKYINTVLFGSEVEIEEETQSSENNPHSCQDNEDCGGGHMDGHRGVPCNTISRHALYKIKKQTQRLNKHCALLKV